MSRRIRERKPRPGETLAQRLLEDGHPLPVSRRQFVGMGLATGTSYLVAPSLISYLRAQDAYAAECPANGGGASSQKVAKVLTAVLDIPGGFPFNHIVPAGGPRGNAPAGEPHRDQRFNGLGRFEGGKFSATGGGIITGHGMPLSESAFMEGLRTMFTPDEKFWVAKYYFSRLQDDTTNNRFHPLSWLASKGVKGDLFGQNPLGDLSSIPSGGYQSPLVDDPKFRAIPIAGESTLLSLTSSSGFSAAQADAIGRLVESLTRHQGARIAASTRRGLVQQVSEMLGCSARVVKETLGGGTSLAWKTDNRIPQFYRDLAKPTLWKFHSESRVDRTISRYFATAIGAAFACTDIPCVGDTHDRTRKSTDDAMWQFGQSLGAGVEIARRNKQDFWACVITDGSQSSYDYTDWWVNDAGSLSSILVFGYSADGVIPRKFQFGHADPVAAGSVDDPIYAKSLKRFMLSAIAGWAYRYRPDLIPLIMEDGQFTLAEMKAMNLWA